MNGSMQWFESKGIWGGVVALGASILGPVAHVSISDIDIAQVANYITALIGAVGGLVAIYGRIKATKQITS